MNTPARRLLIVTVLGAGPVDGRRLAGVPCDGTGGSRTVLPLERPAGRGPHRAIADDATVAALRSLGLSVERRSAILQPPWRGDASSVQQIDRRPAGIADVSMLVLREPLRAAMQHGAGSAPHRAALATAKEHVALARNRLTHGGHGPALVLLAAGAPQPVHGWVEPRPLLPRWLWRRCRPSAAVLRFAVRGHRQRRASLAVLAHGELRRHGKVLEPARAAAMGLPLPIEEICFVPFGGRAFAPVQALDPWLPTAAGEAVLPWPAGDRARVHTDDVAAMVLLHAAALADRAPEPSAAAFPDLEAIGQHDGLEMVEH